jgi:hypothetical protein
MVYVWDFHLLFYIELLDDDLERLKRACEIKQIKYFNLSVHTIFIYFHNFSQLPYKDLYLCGNLFRP